MASAIYTSIQGNEFTKVLPGRVAAASSATGFTGSAASLLGAARNNTAAAYRQVGASASTIAAVQLAVKESNVQSFALVFKVAIAFGGLGILGALCTRSVDVNKKNNSRAALVENEKRPEITEKSVV